MKPINATRINPRLYKVANQPNGSELACYSIVALGAIDTSISVWKPNMAKPFNVVLDLFKSGITDLTWAFNGNFLLGASYDGSVMFV